MQAFPARRKLLFLSQMNQINDSIKLKYSKVFWANYKSKKPIIINRGGARSTKSFSLKQLFILKFLKESNKKFLVCRKTFPSLRITAYKNIVEMLSFIGELNNLEWNKSEHTLTHTRNGNWMLFTSIDDPEKIKSSEFNYIFMEEATDFSLDDFIILKMRMSAPTHDGNKNKMYLALNPISAYHWIKTDLIEKDSDIEEIVSTYRDNVHLSPDYIRLLERTKEQNPSYWKIYGEGEWGILEGLIYPVWSFGRAPEACDEIIYGLDFGFNNPSALLEIKIQDMVFYEKQLLYESGLTNNDLISK